MNVPLVGARQQLDLWISFISFGLFKRPKGVGLLGALNPFGTTLFNDSLHKVCGHLGIDYNPKTTADSCIMGVVKLPDGQTLVYAWKDRAEVGKTISSIYKDEVYGNRPNGVTIDIGAHIGIYSLYASRRGTVYAIEPDEVNFLLLSENANKKIHPFHLAMGSEIGEVKLYSDYLSTMHSVEGEGDKYQIVPMTTLDKFCKSNGIGPIDTVKMDVEGFEMDILKGCGRLLLRGFISNLAIASYHYPDQERDVIEYLESFGYETEVKKAGGEIIVLGWLPY